jgi:hypothetical protein
MLQPSRAPRSQKSDKPTLCTIALSRPSPSHTCHTTAPSCPSSSSPLPAWGLHSPALPRPSSSNPVAEVPKEAPEVSMLLGDPALCARARHALGRPGAIHRRRRTRRCGTRLHRDGCCVHCASEASSPPASASCRTRRWIGASFEGPRRGRPAPAGWPCLEASGDAPPQLIG